MGFFNSVSHSFNRGVNTVNRSGKTAQLNIQLRNLMSQRQNLAAQLGASLYETTRHDPAFTAGREALYDGIASIDAQRAAIEDEIERIRAEQAAQTAAAQTYRCPRCGSTVAATDLFCMGCGMPIGQVIAGQQASAASFARMPGGRVCPKCGAPVEPDDLFCMSCGARVGGMASAEPSPAPPVTATSDEGATSEATPEPSDGSTTTSPEDVASEQEKARAASETSSGAAVPGRRICPNCGAEVGLGEKFCFSCGHRLA